MILGCVVSVVSVLLNCLVLFDSSSRVCVGNVVIVCVRLRCLRLWVSVVDIGKLL